MDTNPKKRTLAKIVLFGFSAIVDFAQVLITFTGVGIVVSEAIEIAMPFALFALFTIFKISIINKPRRVASMLAVGFGDALTGGVAPFWVFDVYYIFRDVAREDALINSEREQSEALANTTMQPLYQNGVRQPQSQPNERPQNKLNKNGIRAPGGGLVKS
ncbi:MAG: hypothetical protein RLY66_70 [Candidatus Parcubacteria bacterium]|jgi:hypothetical protein